MDEDLIWWGVRYALITAGIMGAYCLWAFSGSAARIFSRIRIFRLVHRPESPRWHMLFCTIFLSVSLVFAQVRYDAYAYFFAEESSFIKDNYAFVCPEAVYFPVKKNAVILILESMENTYNDTKVFSEPLLPRLREVQRRHLSFENQRQLYGTGWTIAGMTSYFFGLPLLLFKNQGNVLFDKFMPRASCTLSILEHHGYRMEYVLSGTAEFAGTDKMFSTHSNTFVQGAEYLVKHRPEGKTGRFWGIPDSFTYRWARERFTALAEKDEPFVLIVQSIDTHGPKGFVEKHNIRHGDFRDVLSAADNMACDFLDWIEQQEKFKDTAVIVLGDHLTGFNPLYDDHLLPNASRRTISNAFINVGTKDMPDRRRLCSSFDMAPTILEAMGAVLPERRLGLGTSLFSGYKTLVEEMGEDALNEELKKKSDFYKSLFTIE